MTVGAEEWLVEPAHHQSEADGTLQLSHQHGGEEGGGGVRGAST